MRIPIPCDIDAQGDPLYGNWAGGIVNLYHCLNMVSPRPFRAPFLSSGTNSLNALAFQANMEGQLCKV